jgi:hypothetical protein
MTTVTLSRPIQAHGEERKTIDLREPTGADIIACGGNPACGLQTDTGTVLMINANVIASYLSRLGGIPPSSVAQLSPADWMRCQNAVTGFFNEPEPETASSTDILIAPGSGNGLPERRSSSRSAN